MHSESGIVCKEQLMNEYSVHLAIGLSSGSETGEVE